MFPDRAIVKLRYSDSGTGTSTAGAAFPYIYAGNNIYDPDVTSTGSQPLGYAGYAAQYVYYNVRASAIQLSVISTTTTTQLTQNMICGVYPSLLTTSQPTNINDFMSYPYVKYRISSAAFGSLPSNVITNYMTTAKIMGVLPHMSQADTAFSGGTSGSPVPPQPWYWVIQAACADLTSTGNLLWIVHVDYYVEFWGRKNLTTQ